METVVLIIIGIVLIGAIGVGVLSNFAFFGNVWKGEKSTLDKIILAGIVIVAVAMLIGAFAGL